MISELKSKCIGVICGGSSCERDVSLRSGKKVLGALESLGYQCVLVDPENGINPALFDVAFIALHGKGGEDGAIQGYCETLKIPYTGSGVLASAIGMDKRLTKLMLQHNHLPTAAFEMAGPDNLERPKNLRFPVIIKPAQEGSSVGIEIADDAVAYQAILQKFYHKYSPLMIEEFVEGQEITIGVLDIKGVPTALPILELRPKNRFYDYEAKYTAGMTEFIIPAELSDSVSAHTKDIAVRTHRLVGCRAMSRIDMIVSASGEPIILEINTIPGLTDLSDLPAQAKEYGMSYEALVETILLSAR